MSPSQFQVWEGLVAGSTSAKALTFVVGPTSLMALRKSKPDMKRPFFLKGAKVIAPIAFISATLVVYWAGWTTISLLVPIAIPSVIFYFAFVDKDQKYSGGKIKSHFKSSIWLLVYYVYMLVMSFLGSYIPDDMGPPIIAAPWDTLVCAIGSLFFYYWGVNSGLDEPRIDDLDE